MERGYVFQLRVVVDATRWSSVFTLLNNDFIQPYFPFRLGYPVKLPLQLLTTLPTT